LETRLELQGLPEDHGAAKPARAQGQRSTRAGGRRLFYLIGTLTVLALLGVFVCYVLPALGEPQGARAVIEPIVSAARSETQALWDRARQAARDTLAAVAQREASRGQSSEARRNAQAREAERKEAAWQGFFHRSARCAVEENQTSVACVNEFIRAKREFDRRWDAGEF
jgi:hypothetical protein